jgi:hypothetical protein
LPYVLLSSSSRRVAGNPTSGTESSLDPAASTPWRTPLDFFNEESVSAPASSDPDYSVKRDGPEASEVPLKRAEWVDRSDALPIQRAIFSVRRWNIPQQESAHANPILSGINAEIPQDDPVGQEIHAHE